MGRPSDFTQATADLICERLADGESLRKICRGDGMPAESTVRLWAMDDVQGFSAQYTRSREIGYERLSDELLEIADDGSNDTYETDSGTAVNQDVIARSRLRVDTRKWMLSKMLPKRYGDKITQEHTGAVTLNVTPLDERL